MGKILDEVNAKHNQIKKENKKMKIQNIISTVKDITLIALVSGLIAFYAGMKYQENQANQVETKAATIVKNVKVEVSKE